MSNRDHRLLKLPHNQGWQALQGHRKFCLVTWFGHVVRLDPHDQLEEGRVGTVD